MKGSGEPVHSIDFSPYFLVPKARFGSAASASPRKGALLRVRFQEGFVGYSDLHPWPELGDDSLEEQLRLARQGYWNSQFERSISFARLDGRARSEGRWLWNEMTVPRSHALVSELLKDGESAVEGIKRLECQLTELAEQGFRRIKVKIGSRFEFEVKRLIELASSFRRNSLKVRLDLNGALSPDQVPAFFESLRPVSEWIDWVEDPTVFEGNLWASIQKKWKIRLALDRWGGAGTASLEGVSAGGSSSTRAFSVIVLKPAILPPHLDFFDHQEASWRELSWQEPEQKPGQEPTEECWQDLWQKISWSVTSYLDHPLGQAGAAWFASQMVSYGWLTEDCGLASQGAYYSHPYSESFRIENGILCSGSSRLSKGWGRGDGETGFGWNELLSQESWKSLYSKGAGR